MASLAAIDAAFAPKVTMSMAVGMPLVFDVDGDGVNDIVFVAIDGFTTDGPHQTNAMSVRVVLAGKR